MPRTSIAAEVNSGRVLISDGAWGTFLQKKGWAPGECPDYWSLTRPDDVFAIAEDYITAGSDMIETNSFGASPLKLRHFNLAEKCTQINEAAAKISRRAAGDKKWVLGSIGPSGKMLLLGDVSSKEMAEGFKIQAQALARGGADAICIETMSAIDEAVLAIQAAKENTGCEVICTFTYQQAAHGTFRTMMGHSTAKTTAAALDAGADIIGTNCGYGMAQLIKITREIRQIDAAVPLLVHANAGLPHLRDGVEVFPETAEDMADQVGELLQAGANIIGGCCGTTPEHIRAIKNASLKQAW